jgi:hypothetical protein
MTWTYEASSGAFTTTVLMWRMLRAWHAAKRHGFKVRGVLYRGVPLTPEQIERCNLWIQGGGAEQAAKMEHFDAVRLFEGIIGA